MTHRPEIDDLRLLKLAEMYERAYEAFVLEVAERIVRNDAVREELRKLVGDDRHGERIAAEMTRINAQLGPSDHADVEVAAVEDVVEVERAARDFYLRIVDRVHDPRLVELFRDLATEEEGHMRIALRALVLANGKANPLRPVRGRLARASDDEPPLWEGVTDFGTKHFEPSRRSR